MKWRSFFGLLAGIVAAITVPVNKARYRILGKPTILEGPLKLEPVRDWDGEYKPTFIFDYRVVRLFGCYNQLDRNDGTGRIISGTARTPYELLTLCLVALEKWAYIPSDLPNVYPPIMWDNEPASAALESLCIIFGVRLTYNAKKDEYRFERVAGTLG